MESLYKTHLEAEKCVGDHNVLSVDYFSNHTSSNHFQSATFSPYDTYADYQIQIMTWMTHVFSSLIQMTVHKRAFSYFYCGKRD